MKIFNKMENILYRVRLLSDNEGIKMTSLERIIGASKGVLTRANNNNTDIQLKWLQKIVENYPQYDANWLLTGRGEMLKQTTQQTDVIHLFRDMINKKEAEIKTLQAEIVRLNRDNVALEGEFKRLKKGDVPVFYGAGDVELAHN